MVLADLGRKITSALRSLNNATVINEEVSLQSLQFEFVNRWILQTDTCLSHLVLRVDSQNISHISFSKKDF